MSISVGNVGTISSASTAGSTGVNPGFPSGLVENDVILLFYLLDAFDDNLAGETANTPAGWTKEEDHQVTSGEDRWVVIYSKTATGGETGTLNVSVTDASTIEQTAFMVGFSGVDIATPLDAATTWLDMGAAAVYAPNPAAQTIPENGLSVCGFMTARNELGSITSAPAGWVLLSENLDDVNMGIAYRGPLVSGSYNPVHFSTAAGPGAIGYGITWHAALRPSTTAYPKVGEINAEGLVPLAGLQITPDLSSYAPGGATMTVTLTGYTATPTVARLNGHTIAINAGGSSAEVTIDTPGFEEFASTATHEDTRFDTDITLAIDDASAGTGSSVIQMDSSELAGPDFWFYNPAGGTPPSHTIHPTTDATSSDDIYVRRQNGVVNSISTHGVVTWTTAGGIIAVSHFDESAGLWSTIVEWDFNFPAQVGIVNAEGFKPNDAAELGEINAVGFAPTIRGGVTVTAASGVMRAVGLAPVIALAGEASLPGLGQAYAVGLVPLLSKGQWVYIGKTVSIWIETNEASSTWSPITRQVT